MRNRLRFVAAAMFLTAMPAQAQQPPTSGFVDFSVRATNVSGDAARFQRYRDLRDRGSIEALRFDRATGRWRFESGARHLGRKDQSLFASAQNSKLKASFTWDQVPYFTSADTRTPFLTESPGVLRLDDAMQYASETGTRQLSDTALTARRFDLQSRRHTGAFDLVYSPTRAIDVTVSLKETRREGSQALTGSFGFTNIVELPAPVDTRTRDVKADAEWAGDRGTVRVGYDGSWFDNNVPALVWDNPMKLTDAVTASGYRDGLAGAQGRMALWPNSTMHGLSTAGSLKLPARTRVNANVRAGIVRQNQPLLPVTINTAAPDLPLPRDTAGAEARTLAVNVAVTSRPVKYLWMNVRYRAYDFDNRTPAFATPFLVMDQTLHESAATSPSSYTRANLDMDASATAFRSTTFRAGYTRATDDRTFRIFERTIDNVYRASVDSVWKVFTLRAIAEQGERRGTGLDEQLLEHAGEQPALRHYDVADRDRRRVTGLVQVTPLKALAFSGSLAVGDDEYANSGFGLRDNDNRAYTATVDLMPSPRIGWTATYAGAHGATDLPQRESRRPVHGPDEELVRGFVR
jgi:MtrB/PioB family decaheme-associated outer membrane protein